MTDEQRDKIRRAIALPGWSWRALNGGLGEWTDSCGNVYRPRMDRFPGRWVKQSSAVVVADDPATAGCLLALLGDGAWRAVFSRVAGQWLWWDGEEWLSAPSLGWACVEAALALGRWPGGITR